MKLFKTAGSVITPSLSQAIAAPESSMTNVPMRTSSGEEGYRGLAWYNLILTGIQIMKSRLLCNNYQ